MEKLEFNIDSSEKSVRIDKYLAECCPDLSRSYLQKLLKDCMTTVGFWKDDALVASEIVEKFWARIPGIYIKIEELP